MLGKSDLVREWPGRPIRAAPAAHAVRGFSLYLSIDTTAHSAIVPAVMAAPHPHLAHPAAHHTTGAGVAVHRGLVAVPGRRSIAVEAVARPRHAGRVRAEQETERQGGAKDELIHR